jgi:hypothetical protein
MSATAITAPPEARPRPGLALLLALLAVPGVTIAWELPSGGFWIGVPLAVAAIVIARRAAGSRIAVAAIALATVEILFTATWTVVELVAG